MQLRAAAHVLRIRCGARPAPVSVGFEVTHRCNLSCRYCDRHTPQAQEMTTQQILVVLRELLSLGMRTISLDGGEPLAHPDIREVVQWLTGHDVRVNMNSNAILVPRKLDVVRSLSKLKVSLDGPREIHDSSRGRGAYARALRGIVAAREVGVPVELTCVIGEHNAQSVDSVIGTAASLGLRVVFQPERASLFHGIEPTQHSALPEIRRAFKRIEHHKRTGRTVANMWTSLVHFRSFPRDTALPCAAGHISATLDPYGNLYPCGLVSRDYPPANVLRDGVTNAFRALPRTGCAQCWCARVVEENFAWGGRIDRMLAPRPLGDEKIHIPGRSVVSRLA